MVRRRTPIRVGALVLGVGAAALAQSGKSLILNGQVASHDVRLIDGRPYVPLADVARALGQTVVTRAGGYEITSAGGAATLSTIGTFETATTSAERLS